MPVLGVAAIRAATRACAIALLPLSLAAIAACATTRRPRATADATAVRAAREEWNRALARHDSSALAALVEDSAVHVSPRFTHAGRAEYLAGFLGPMAARPGFHLVYTPERVASCARAGCDVATEYGRWRETWREAGERTEVSGTYYAIWRRHGGRWQLRGEAFATQECRGERYCAR